MGRPLNKKYFGNRNIGTGGDQIGGNNSNNQNYSDDRIGGEGIASINWSNYGSWLATAGGAAAPLAGLQLPSPTLPGGVQATWTNYFGAAAVTTGAGKTGLISGETYEYAPIPGLIVTVGSLSGANALFTVTAPGSTTTLLTDLQTVSLTLRTGQGHTGVSTFTVDIQLKIVNTVIGEKGSGYTGAETFTVTTANGATGTAPAGTLVLTTDSGSVGSSTNQENAIVIRANLGEGVEIGDIIRQVSTRRYKVKLANGGTGIVELESGDSTPNEGKAMIVATSGSGATYYVTKLTGHKATLATKTGDGALDGQSVQWTFEAPSGSIVQIENA
jgi:hypothetical protein